jgi:hypothetical protein
MIIIFPYINTYNSFFYPNHHLMVFEVETEENSTYLFCTKLIVMMVG